MTLTAAPATLPALSATTVCEAFQITAAAFADEPALRGHDGGGALTWREYAARVESIARGLSGAGVGPGDVVALLLDTRPEFSLVDAAVMHLGATPFSIYNTSSPEQIECLLGNAGARIVVTEVRHLATMLAVVERGCALDRVVLVDGEHPEATSLAALEAAPDLGLDFEAAWRAVGPEDVLTLIYTSGTTGPPKGVELTHGNLMAQWRALAERIPPAPGGRLVTYLPHAHIADRLVGHYQAIVSGASLTSVGDVREVVGALPSIRPTGFMAVPRIWEKLKAALEARGLTDPHGLDEEARSALRAQLGLDAAVSLLCGAAPIAPEVLEYFAAVGLPICEGWGMSEVCGVGTVNPPGAIRVGTVGPVLPGMEVRLAPDGELLLRGANVMRGYRGDPARTAEALDAGGWLHTGDIAEVDDDGYVRIVDRKKELIINAAGKNMSPAAIEGALKGASPLIGQACAIGDRRPCNVALIVLDPDAAAAWAAANDAAGAGLAELAADPRVQAEVAAAVTGANDRLSRVEQVKRFAILPDEWLADGDELTPTMKLKRRAIDAKYAAQIDALYDD